jgi:adenylosuccinate lyase
MITRYAREEMSSIWNMQSKYQAWLDVEKAVVKAWCDLGLIPKEDRDKIVKNASFDIKEIDKIEKETKHDVIAFLTSVSNTLGKESRWVHYGLTSSDCIDTANALLLKESMEIILKDIKKLMGTLKKRALEHKNTLMVGRSHGIHGEPITLGLTLALWYEEIKRSYKNAKDSLEMISVGQASGAMGNFAHSPLELEEKMCEYLGLQVENISNQVIQRDRYAYVINNMALLASSCEKMAVAIRHHQRSEVYEIEEFFAKGQKGSSAMPHKRNPILTENITGLCRMIRSFALPTMENVALWHERDISHSSVERFVLPDTFITMDFMLNRLDGVIDKMVVYDKNMMKNLNMTGGLVFSQRILLELPLKGLSREDSYIIVQRNAMKVWEDLQNGIAKAIDENNNTLFLKYLLKDEDLLKEISKEEIKQCFDYSYYTKNIDSIFKRVF